MFWTDCIRILTCGLFGPPGEDEYLATRKLNPQRTEVKYTFDIENNCTVEEDDNSCDLDSSEEWDYPSPINDKDSDSDSDSSWDVLEEN